MRHYEAIMKETFDEMPTDHSTVDEDVQRRVGEWTNWSVVHISGMTVYVNADYEELVLELDRMETPSLSLNFIDDVNLKITYYQIEVVRQLMPEEIGG